MLVGNNRVRSVNLYDSSRPFSFQAMAKKEKEKKKKVKSRDPNGFSQPMLVPLEPQTGVEIFWFL